MDPAKFSRIAESLRQYRRADLKDFSEEIGARPVDQIYVDPLPNDGVLTAILSTNTTFLSGRKGTGKSTVFAKAQNRIRETANLLSVYIDVKRLYDVLTGEDPTSGSLQTDAVDSGVLKAHLLRKHFLGTVTAELLKELDATIDSQSFIERVFGKKKNHATLKANLVDLQKRLATSSLSRSEIPILQKITQKWKSRRQQEFEERDQATASAEASSIAFKARGEATISEFDKTLEDNEIYTEYSDVILRTFPFQSILTEIQDLLDEAGMLRLVAFFDDFSELKYLDQKLFVDVVLAPLNNSSNEKVKLKVAGYPGRVYYGKIDPTKVDTMCLDFATLFEAAEVQTMEASAIDYAERLIRARFEAFGERVEDYFDSTTPIAEHFKLLFQTTFNVPRLMGSLLHICYIDRISRDLPITTASLKLAARKYYEATVTQYFDRTNRFALEPFENKLDRHNQKGLLEALVAEARRVRRGIQDGTVGGVYFKQLANPPTSHFIVLPSLESLFRSLESNFLLTKYKDTRDKNGDAVVLYAFYYGLTESERMTWGYPEGREYRNYFVQRCFEFSSVVHNFLSEKKTIRCDLCGRSFPLEQKASFELFKWRCPECGEGVCSIVNIKGDFETEVNELNRDLMIEEVELEILSTLHDEGRRMRSGEISALLDVTYQFVGKRTSKLQDMGLVQKERGEDGRMQNEMTERARQIYFQ
jgi:hypothetical protein